MNDQWDTQCFQDNILFKDFVSLISVFEDFENWPSLSDYNLLLASHCHELRSLSGAQLEFVAQDKKTSLLSESYEARIHQRGEIQTRLHNWHDFFQVIIWCTYLQTKRLINDLHYRALLDREACEKRTPAENCLTLFDECGAIIVSSDPGLLELVKSFKWQDLFVQNRQAFGLQIQCFIFGHAVLEKCLNPYLGMTAHSICLEVSDSFFLESAGNRRQLVDQAASLYFTQQQALHPGILHPFPLLGVPGWDSRNEHPDYYQNTHYFRPGRKKQPDRCS